MGQNPLPYALATLVVLGIIGAVIAGLFLFVFGGSTEGHGRGERCHGGSHTRACCRAGPNSSTHRSTTFNAGGHSGATRARTSTGSC